MKLNEILDVEKLSDHICNRLVGVQRHPSLPLKIYNYTQNAQFDPHWGDGTIDYCRGLIVDDQDNVIARPFKKFHNLNTEYIPETMEANLPKTTPTILEKYDGSLGILYRYYGEYGIATRGSFTSPQALWATEWFKDRVGFPYSLKIEIEHFTFLFEIIYKNNRIVVDYDWEGLVHIGTVHKQSGKELSPKYHKNVFEANECFPIKTAREINLSLKEVLCINTPNEEGFVVSYPGLKVKIKMADYVRLHKIVTGMNARSVWELLSTGKDFTQFESMPEQFQRWLKCWVKDLNSQHDNIFTTCQDFYKQCPSIDTEIEPYRDYRKRFALWVQSETPKEFHSVMFAMLDNQDPSSVIWKMIKPRGDDQTFRTEGE